MGERCCRVPGDAAGPTIASIKKFNQQHWLWEPAMLSLCPCPAHVPLHPAQLWPEHIHPCPLCTTLGCSSSWQGAKVLPTPCPAVGMLQAGCIGHRHGQQQVFLFDVSQWVGCFLFVCFKSVLILVCP